MPSPLADPCHDGDWQIWIDVGGTFTDCLARRPDGEIESHKLLSTGAYKARTGPGGAAGRLLLVGLEDPPPGFFEGYTVRCFDAKGGEALSATVKAHSRLDTGVQEFLLESPLAGAVAPGLTAELKSHEPAPVSGIRRLLGRRLADPVGPALVKLGTTRGTNALLEHRGAKTAFITTAGFEDVLAIAYQNRPRLFDLNIKKPKPLYDLVLGVKGRLAADGSVLEDLDLKALEQDLRTTKSVGIQSLAICLLNSYRNHAHEEAVAELAEKVGFEQISVSTRLAPLQRIVPRGDTAVVDAYLTPVIAAYVQQIKRALPQIDLRLMTSAGTLVDAERFHGKDSVLSGPAGGVVGVALTARDSHAKQVIGFDMGGTSTDICRYDGEFERRYEMELVDPERGTGCRIVAPMLWVETVAAGGGSICTFDGTRLTVGPESAGAEPGPACYGRGGPLTITDCNLLAGRIVSEHFAFPLDGGAALARLESVREAVAKATGKPQTPAALAHAFLAIAASNMAQPIRRVSIARGFDVREHALVAFGGAGAQHACQLADELGIRRIVVPEYASYLSAQGIGNADTRAFAVTNVGLTLTPTAAPSLEKIFSDLETEARRDLAKERGQAGAATTVKRRLDLRYTGQDSTLSIEEPAGDDWAAAFTAAHQQRFGFTFDKRAVEARAARVEVIQAAKPSRPPARRPKSVPKLPSSVPTTRLFAEGQWHEAAVWSRQEIPAGTTVSGPALIAEASTLLVVEPGWSASIGTAGQIEVVKGSPKVPPTIALAPPLADGSAVDPVSLTLYINRFTAIAEEMGTTLMRTALSVNVKERLDFSCAVFGPDGSLVVNAPHIPVHLGSMGDTVRALIRDLGMTMRPGDVYVTNDPYRGGSHLPDVTTVTPVFDAAGKTLLFFTGSRAHHAEIGGTSPGSMPPDAKSLAEEGVLLRCVRWRYGEDGSEDELRRLLGSGPWPSRSIDINLADLRAQASANALGRERLISLVETFGLPTVTAYMGHIRAASTLRLRQALSKLSAGTKAFRDAMDDGTPIAVALTVRSTDGGPRLTVDFTGTGPVAAGNLNANLAIVKAATLYALRCLIAEDIPLNEGVLAPVDFIVPSPSILNPPLVDEGRDSSKLAAVNAGNVETSQRLVDVLLGALGLAAASQGTMNNLLFGRAATGAQAGFGYYETICGGAGAGPGFAGASAVHTHMTNTRITDPEVLEERFPVRLKRFAIRAGSGGAGEWRGGDGVIREIEFLAPVELSLITSRRVVAPWGLNGGRPGLVGKNVLVRKDGKTEVLPPMARRAVDPGDSLILETPGGGGFGAPSIK